ncbi:MAG TPA: glycosyltransferase family 4 protein [Vicinamibacterales bacterium]|nr:glycosyltransferase family 4 protein [Vicinamibacterales bacterium]
MKGEALAMRVAIVNPVWEPAVRTPEETLQRFRSLTGWSSAVAAAGATVSVHQRFPSSSTAEVSGVFYAFVRDGGTPRPGRLWIDARPIAASVQALKPDLVHVNGVIFPEWLRSLRRALPSSIRMVAQDHGGWDPADASLWSRLWVRRGLSAMDALLVSSPGHAVAWRLASAVPPGVRVADVMEAGTDLRPMPSREAAALSGVTGHPAILWVGRLTQNKDPLTMLEGFSQLLDVCPDARLTVVYSSATMEGAVHERIARDPRLPSRVRVVGAIAASQMAAYYSAADIFVSASHREGSGYAAIEAMACGAAPVVTDIPSFRVLTDDGRVGALWQRGDARSLRDALVRVAAEPRGTLRARVLAQYGSALSWEVLGRRAVGIYRDVCDR